MNNRPSNILAWLPFLWARVLFPSRDEPVRTLRRGPVACLVILPALLLYPTLNFRLLEPDEGRYAQLAREMVASGDWIVPHLQGQPYLDKPPLMYWLIALSYTLFGVSEASARIIPALATHGTILLVYLLGRRAWGERSAFWGALLLCVAPVFTGMSRLLILDGLLTFWITFAGLCLYESLRGSTLHRGWWYGAALAVGCGVLTKGPIPLLLLVPPLWLHRRLVAKPVMLPWRSLLGFVGVVLLLNLPWYLAILIRQPIFLKYFFWEHNILRFVKPFDHLQPVWYYAPIFLAGLVPGTFLLYGFGRYLLAGAPEQATTRTLSLGFALLVGLWCVVFFSMSGSKLPTYILPAFPFICLALGHFIAHASWQRATWLKLGIGVSFAVSAFAFYVGIPWYAERRSPMGPPETAALLQSFRHEPMYCFPRNVDSVAFYTERADLLSVRTKVSQDLIERLIQHDRAVVLFTHKHSLETFKQVLPKQLRVREAYEVKHSGAGSSTLDKLVGDGPWGLCHIAVIERLK